MAAMNDPVMPNLSGGRAARILGLALCATIVLSPVLASASDTLQQQLVDQAHATVEAFTSDPSLKEALSELGPQARALFILPDFVRWGLVVGGGTGKGILMVRGEKTGRWSQPVFFNVSAFNLGAQVGADVSEVIVVIRTQEALDQFYGTAFKMGASAGLAKGPTGEGTSVHGIAGDMVAYARKRGVFAGAALGSALVSVAADANRAYYAEQVTPRDIVGGRVVNPRSLDLRNAAAKLINKN